MSQRLDRQRAQQDVIIPEQGHQPGSDLFDPLALDPSQRPQDRQASSFDSGALQIIDLPGSLSVSVASHAVEGQHDETPDQAGSGQAGRANGAAVGD
jgi:hypothetical protein